VLKVHLTNGETITFDLSNPEHAQRWLRHIRSRSFQDSITSLSLNLNGVQYALSRPNGFGDVSFFADLLEPHGRFKGGERLHCNAGEIGIVLLAHAGQRSLRVDVTMQGKQKYNPLIG
jgi:hypothetical protein